MWRRVVWYKWKKVSEKCSVTANSGYQIIFLSYILINYMNLYLQLNLATPSVPDIIRAAITAGRRLLEIRVTKLVKEIPAFPATHKCSSVITKGRHSIHSWVNLIQLTFTTLNSSRSILILSSHQRMSPKKTLFWNFFRQKFCMHFLFHILRISSILILST